MFSIILLYCIPIKAETIDVCKTCKYSSIKSAIEVAKDFDTIHIKKGTYKEHSIVVNKPLTIIGDNYPIIDGEKKEKYLPLYQITLLLMDYSLSTWV